MSHMRTRLIRLGAVAVASAAGLGLAGGTAGGIAGAAASASSGGSGNDATPATLSGIQAKASTDVTKRVNALNAAIAKVNAATGLGSGQATLASLLGADIAPLQQLNTKIQGDTTVQQARADYGTIFSGYRVYLLVLPAARIAGDADRITNTVLPRLTSAASKAQARENANNAAQLQPLLTDLNAQISAAANATNGLAGTVLGYTPTELNGNHELLSPARSDDQTANAAIKKGRQDVAEIVQVLRPGLAGRAKAGTVTTTTG
ncbi:MAG TPA: hypothetical protein VG244_01945 [Acidimicrobiales bacterium]|jgi:hypothetical protein|nr:hypothetical protein [Acidimicrobiales bacterium]